MIGRSALLSDSLPWTSDKTGRNACGPVAIRIRQREFRSIQYQEYSTTFCDLRIGRNVLYCYGFPNLRMRFCGMYGVPAALAITDAVGSGRTSRLTAIRDPSVVVAAMVVRCQRPSLVRSVAHLWLIPCAARRVRMTLTPYSASTAMNRWASIRLLSWCQTGRNPSSDLSDWNVTSSSVSRQ